jgi:peptidoglycan/LPS O-acetylase OafA/YrhL
VQADFIPARIKAAIAGKQVPVLDGVRGFAVSYVILYHFIPSTLSVTYKSKILELWDTFWMMGWSGVDLFFVLSGFLITGILYQSKNDKNYFRNFYIRRFLRIFPIYYLILFVCLIVAPISSGVPAPPNSIYYWFYLSNFDTELKMPLHPVLVVAWSLAIEEQYYICYPTLVRLLSLKNWARLLIGLVVLSISLRYLGHYLHFFAPRQEYHFTLAHFDGIALGGLLRLAVMRYDKFGPLLNRLIKWIPAVVIASWSINLLCGHMVLQGLQPGRAPDRISFQPPMYLMGYTLNAIFYGSIILLCLLREGPLFRFFNNPALREIGKVSYGMYLLQYPARMFVEKILPESLLANPWIKTVLVFGACYGIARVSWTIYESPILRLKERFAKHEERPIVPQRA